MITDLYLSSSFPLSSSSLPWLPPSPPSPHKIEKWPLCHCSLMDRTGSEMLSNFIAFTMQRPRIQTFVMSVHTFGAFPLFWEEGWDKIWKPICPFIKKGPSIEGCEGLKWRKLQDTFVHLIWFPTSTQCILKSGLVSFRLIFVPCPSTHLKIQISKQAFHDDDNEDDW